MSVLRETNSKQFYTMRAIARSKYIFWLHEIKIFMISSNNWQKKGIICNEICSWHQGLQRALKLSSHALIGFLRIHTQLSYSACLCQARTTLLRGQHDEYPVLVRQGIFANGVKLGLIFLLADR